MGYTCGADSPAAAGGVSDKTAPCAAMQQGGSDGKVDTGAEDGVFPYSRSCG